VGLGGGMNAVAKRKIPALPGNRVPIVKPVALSTVTELCPFLY
jgi:hypothetical protein